MEPLPVYQPGSVTSESGLDGATRAQSDFSSVSSMPHRSADLIGMIEDYTAADNTRQPFAWTATTESILAKDAPINKHAIRSDVRDNVVVAISADVV